MARLKSFNETDVLTQAMDLFWKQGYRATSMRELEKVTQLTAGSIYHEFGSKKELFRRTLKFYATTIIGWRIEKYLVDYTQPIDGIYQFLITSFEEPFRSQSCLLVNSAMEFGQSDEKINTIINKGTAQLTLALQNSLQRAKEQKLINHSVETDAGAQYIILMIPGLLLSAKNGAKKSEVEAAIKLHMYPFIQ